MGTGNFFSHENGIFCCPHDAGGDDGSADCAAVDSFYTEYKASKERTRFVAVRKACGAERVKAY